MAKNKQENRVLYIEDDPGQRRELARFLRTKRYIVTVASSGNVGLKYFNSRSFDAILCDLNIPGINGLKLLEKVRVKDTAIPVIILTAHGTVSLAVKAIKQGADQFILKTASQDEILVTLKQSIERSRLMRRLEKSELTLKLVSENVPDVIYSLNPRGEFTSLSSAVEQTIHYKPSELLGTSVFDVIHPDDRKRVLDNYRESIKKRDRKTKTLQFRMIAKNGEIRHFEISRKMMFKDGHAVRSDGIARDVTERIDLENRLKEYSQQLEKKVEERTVELSRANRQLAELNRISNNFSKIHDQQKLFKVAPRALIKSLDFDRAYLALKSNGGLEIVSYYCHTKIARGLLKYIEDINKGIIKAPIHLNRCIRQKKTIFVPDLKSEKSWPKKPAYMVRAKSMVIAPLIIENEVTGLIVGFRDEDKDDLDTQDVARFEMFAKIVSFTLGNIRAYQSLERKVDERTKSLKNAYEELRNKTKEIDASRMELAKANVELLSVQEQLEAKNAEMAKLLDELSQKHMELQVVVDAAPEVILMVDNDGIIRMANRAVGEYFNLSKSELVDRRLKFFLDRIREKTEDKNRFDKLIKQLIKTSDNPEFFNMELLQERGLAYHGKQDRIIVPTSMKIDDENGAEVGRLWDFVDITKMIEAEERIRAIVNASPIPTIISRIENGEVLYANDHLAKLVGMERPDVIGQFTPEFYYDLKDRDEVINRLKRDGYVRDIEVRLKRLDGTPVWTIFSLVITEISGENVVLGGIYDISRQKEAETALITERNFVTAVLDTTSSLVVVLDTEGRIVRFNRACEKITGFKADEVRNHPFWDMLITPDEIDKVKERFSKLIFGEYPNRGENYWLTKGGDKRLIYWSNTVLLDSQGEITHIVATGIDITEQRQAQQELKLANENLARANENLLLYKEIFMNTNDGIMIMDETSTVLERNPAQSIHTGVPDHDFIGKKPAHLVGMEKFEEIYDLVLKTGSYRGEIDFIRHDGIEKNVDLLVFPLKDNQGKIKYYIGMGRDITERKTAERTITNRLRYEEGLANCSQALLTGVDPEQAVEQALSHLLQATQTSRVYVFENFDDETKGLCARMVYEVCAAGIEPRKDVSLLQRLPYGISLSNWQEILEKGESVGILVEEMPLKTRELLESFGVLSIAVIPIIVESRWWGFLGFDDMINKRQWNDEDLRTLQTAGKMLGIYSERKSFEEALKVSEERFRTLVENANDIIYSTTADNILTYVSPTVTEILGYPPSDVIGLNANSLMHPEDREDADEFNRHHEYKERERWSGYRFRMRHKDGSYKWFVTNASVLFDDEGGVREVIGVAHDITEIQNLLEALERANVELRSAQSQLIQSEKMASLGMLVAGIAHEINTPIGAASSMHDTSTRAQVKLRQHLREKYKDDIINDDVLQKTLNIIDESNKIIESGVGRVINIVRRLKSFARLDEAELQPINIHEGLEDTLTLIHHEIKHGITIEKEFSELPEITCFPGQLNQVFLNLLVNASQAISGKGTITIRTYHRNDKVFIEIADTGSGIKPEHLEKIFDPGFTTKGVGVGTGLGLSICYQIMQNHRGKISAISEVSKGTTLTLELPINLEELLERDANDK